MTARLAIGTGLGHAELIRERCGLRWGVVSVVLMVVVDLLAYVAEFAAIVLGASLVGIPAGPAVAAALVFHTLVVLTGNYRRFEVATLVLSLALFAFVGLAIMAGPDPRAVLGGFSPVQPFDRPGYLDLVVATVGAVIMPWMLFYQQAATVEKRLGPDDLRAARWETFVGAIASEVLMAAVVIAAAAAVDSGAGAQASAGGLALPAGLAALAQGVPGVLIAVGMIGSGLLAAVVISLSSAWAWSELLHWPHSLNLSPRRAPGFYAVYLVEVIPAAIVALVAQDLVAVVIDAMILNVLVLVVPLTFLVRLSSDRSLLGARCLAPLHGCALGDDRRPARTRVDERGRSSRSRDVSAGRVARNRRRDFGRRRYPKSQSRLIFHSASDIRLRPWTSSAGSGSRSTALAVAGLVGAPSSANLRRPTACSART